VFVRGKYSINAYAYNSTTLMCFMETAKNMDNLDNGEGVR